MFSFAAGSDVLNFISSISADVFALLGVVALIAVIGVAKGKRVIIAILFSLYPAAFISMNIPQIVQLESGALASLFLFVVSIVAISFVLVKYMKRSFPERTFWRMVEIIALSVSVTGLLFALLYHAVRIESVHNFGVIADTLFASPIALFVWLLAPLISIPLFVRP